jgi:hypothetical protein
MSNTTIQQIVTFFNTRLDNQDYNHVSIEEIKRCAQVKRLKIKPNPKETQTKLIIKPKPKETQTKLIIKPKPKEKQTKLIIKPKTPSPKIKLKIKPKLPDPSEFNNEYRYFIEVCSILKLPVYKYETTLWSGPSIIIHSFDNFNNKIRNNFKIDTHLDTLSEYKIAIYPSKNIRDNDITYNNIYKTEIESEKFEYKTRGTTLYIDKQTRDMLESLNELEKNYYIDKLINLKN